MTLYRGPGGTGSATSDADTTLYQDFLNQTIAARDAALQAEINAELAETNAETAETNAETAETNAETAATNAASSASAAASSASSASTSASNASTSASAASTSATNAASSASSASSSASAASTSASNAATSETNAANSASSASTSATNAANSASTATTQATNAASSATAAASSASSASTSATNAANSASAASTSATNAANSATSAAASASAAAASAASIDPTTLVRTTGTQTIGGDKTFSSNPTLSAGTANGVLFLNAGKAISSGTAFSFDGSSVTVKTSSGGYLNLDSTATGTSNTIASLLNNSAAYAPLNYNATAHVYQISSSEGMRLTSTGLGIGTSSPGGTLDVAGSGYVRFRSSTVYVSFGDNGYIRTDAANILRFQPGSGGYQFRNAGNSDNLAVLDSSGNLGLGVTPSAWISTIKAFDFGARGSLYAVDDTNLINNAFINSGGSWRYKAGTGVSGDGASRYNQYSGVHSWFTAPSGTAGNAISFTQAMTLDASGRLGIGTASPGATLSVDCGSASLMATFNSTNANGGYFALASSAGTYGDIGTAAQVFTTGSASDFGVNARGSRNLVLGTNNTERARIDSSGRFGIATSSPQASLTVGSVAAGTAEATNRGLIQIQSNGGGSATGGGGLEFKSASSGGGYGWMVASPDLGAGSVPLVFSHRNDSASWTERARIDSSGNLLVGTTVTPSSSSSGCSIEDGAMRTSFGSYTGAGDHIFFINGNGTVGRISSNGTTTTYNTSSDYRLKENIQPMTGALAKLAALKPCTYKWKADGSDGEGFIAHELAEVVPQCVTGDKDAVDAEGKPVYQGIDTSFLVATLTAAIQEQQAIINQLKADVAALKGA